MKKIAVEMASDKVLYKRYSIRKIVCVVMAIDKLVNVMKLENLPQLIHGNIGSGNGMLLSR